MSTDFTEDESNEVGMDYYVTEPCTWTHFTFYFLHYRQKKDASLSRRRNHANVLDFKTELIHVERHERPENSCLARANPDSAPARNREVRPSDRMGWIPCTSDQTIEHLGGLQWWWTIEIGLCILCITANGDIFAGEQSVFRGVDFRGGDIQTFCVGCTVELLYEMHHIVLLRVRIDETRRDQVLGGWSDRQQRQPMV